MSSQQGAVRALPTGHHLHPEVPYLPVPCAPLEWLKLVRSARRRPFPPASSVCLLCSGQCGARPSGQLHCGQLHFQPCEHCAILLVRHHAGKLLSHSARGWVAAAKQKLKGQAACVQRRSCGGERRRGGRARTDLRLPLPSPTCQNILIGAEKSFVLRRDFKLQAL